MSKKCMEKMVLNYLIVTRALEKNAGQKVEITRTQK